MMYEFIKERIMERSKRKRRSERTGDRITDHFDDCHGVEVGPSTQSPSLALLMLLYNGAVTCSSFEVLRENVDLCRVDVQARHGCCNFWLKAIGLKTFPPPSPPILRLHFCVLQHARRSWYFLSTNAQWRPTVAKRAPVPSRSTGPSQRRNEGVPRLNRH